MGLKDKVRRLARVVEREMITIEQVDGIVKRFHRDAFKECFIHETERGRRHYFGEEPGPPHPIIEALRKVSDEEMRRVLGEHGTLLGDLLGEDQIIRGERECPGPPVRETSPGVYE